jgi:molecular chaperone DnaK
VTRVTIDFGIDLGTTNSCIACARGTGVEIIRNNERMETTPSAVAIDRKGRLHVGRGAKVQFETDEANACIEFKLQMGRTYEKTFQRSGLRLKPEEMSAEVLKSLLDDVHQLTGEQVDAAVITVPADFDLPQCDATRRAARLAGLAVNPLLQEPVAAALAHGFQSDSDKVYWMVYDLGGGTFDAAIIQMRDGMFRVVNHGGDRHLGGKLIDWAIVEQLLVPALTKEYPLEDFRRGVERWRAAFAKLKFAAEQAKIRLSRDASTDVSVEFPDAHGTPIYFEYDLRRQAVEALIEPYVLRTINICKKVLAEKRLGPGDLEKVLLVGGPTLTPYLRERVADTSEGLGIPLEVRLDPMTVVAAGAAIFAGSQRRETTVEVPVTPDKFTLHLEYQPIGTDPEPVAGGKVQAPTGGTVEGFTIEFIDADARPPRRSGKVRLPADGTFVTNLWSTPGRTTTFQIELQDASGRRCPTVPDRFTYTFGNVPTDPPLIHSLGVAMANNEMDVFIPKGTSLPARKRLVHRTTRGVRRGQDGEFLRIPVVEGENTRRADRNRLVGTLQVTTAQLKRDVPANSEVEITIEIDSSRLLRTHAFIPLLDEEFADVIHFHTTGPDLAQLTQTIGRELERLQQLEVKAREMKSAGALQVLKRMEDERISLDLIAALPRAADDPDAADNCQLRLLDLMTGLDQVEAVLELPTLVTQAEESLAELRRLVAAHGTLVDRLDATNLERETRTALQSRDVEVLRHKTKELVAFCWRFQREQPATWIGLLKYLQTKQVILLEPALAEQLFQRAHLAVKADDFQVLRATTQQILDLLPLEEKQSLGYGGSTMR